MSLWLGDSYTYGVGAGGPGDGEACLTAAKLHWVCKLDAEGGTGFVADGHENSKSHRPLGDRLEQTATKYAPNVVVIDAGRNDFGASRSSLRTATEAYFKRVHQAWPDARLVVVAPYLLGHSESPDGAWFTTFEKGLADEYGGVFIDPVADGWASKKGLTISDHVHPSPEGHAWIAEHLAKSLRSITQ